MDRIDLIASLAKGSKCVVDVGCDHAYASIRAVKYYGCESAIACDINEGPLKSAQESIIENHLEDKIKTVLSDGLKEIIDEFDTVIVAGMGGSLIRDILRESYNKIYGKKIIVEANKDSDIVRKYLTDNGFMISKEYAITDNGKYYEIIVFKNGICDYSEKEIKYGPMLLANKPEAFIKHYEALINVLSKGLSEIKDPMKKKNLERNISELNEIIGISFNEKEYINGTSNYYRTFWIDDETRPTIIISAGGGYQYTSPREEEPVMKKYHEKGYHVVIVNYRETKDEAYPLPQSYLAYVIGLIQDDYHVSKLIGLGFSAGGHCMLEVNCHNKDYNIRRCDLLMLAYPVVTSDERYSHKGSFEHILFEKYGDPKLMNYLSLETQIDDSMPDLFLWGTFTDSSVNVMNSLLLLEAYKKHNLNAEYHLFPLGPHGLSVANIESAQGNEEKIIPYVEDWVSYSLKWLEYKLK